MAKEYIEREIPLQQIRVEGLNLLEQEGRRTNEVLAYGHCFGIVDSVPAADVVEVVKCKNCKYYGWEHDLCHGRTEHFCKLHKGLTVVNKETFCCYGERMDNGNL